MSVPVISRTTELLLFGICLHSMLLAQTTSPQSQVDIVLSVSLSKANYFPCEEIQFVVKAANQGTSKLDISSIHEIPNAYYYIVPLDFKGKLSYWPVERHHEKPTSASLNANEIHTLAAGEVRSEEVNAATVPNRPPAPCQAGSYALVYTFMGKSAAAVFKVELPDRIQAIFEFDSPIENQISEMPILKTSQGLVEKKRIAFSYRKGNLSSICVTVSDSFSLERIRNRPLATQIGVINRDHPLVPVEFRCLAELPEEISSIHVKRDALGNLKIDYGTPATRIGTIEMDSKTHKLR